MSEPSSENAQVSCVKLIDNSFLLEISIPATLWSIKWEILILRIIVEVIIQIIERKGNKNDR